MRQNVPVCMPLPLGAGAPAGAAMECRVAYSVEVGVRPCESLKRALLRAGFEPASHDLQWCAQSTVLTRVCKLKPLGTVVAPLFPLSWFSRRPPGGGG